jgi:hypothetical protein
MTEAIEKTMLEDRMLRDAARALVDADMANLRANYAARGIGARIKERVSEGAADALEEAVAVADENKGVVATLLAAVVLWLARHPIINLIGELADDEEREHLRNRWPGKS